MRQSSLALANQTESGPPEFEFRTADGVHASDDFRSAELLLLEELWDRTPDRLLSVQANYGVVGTVLDSVSDVTMTESSARAARLCRENARRNDTDAAVELTADLTTLDGDFDAAAYAPRPYTSLAVGQQRAVDALATLDPGGRLYLAATPQAGLHRFRNCLDDVAQNVTSVASEGDCEVLAATRHYDIDTPEYVTSTVRETRVDGTLLSLVTAPGLFAAGGLDHGTRLLLETVDVADGERVLDLCCGYGPIGAYAAKTADCEVTLTDDDARATVHAERTLDASGVQGSVVTADATRGVDGPFDRVLSNPPTHAGEGVLADLFGGAQNVLAPGGRFTVVHHRALDLSRQFGGFESVDERTVGEEHVVVEARP